MWMYTYAQICIYVCGHHWEIDAGRVYYTSIHTIHNVAGPQRAMLWLSGWGSYIPT